MNYEVICDFSHDLKKVACEAKKKSYEITYLKRSVKIYMTKITRNYITSTETMKISSNNKQVVVQVLINKEAKRRRVLNQSQVSRIITKEKHPLIKLTVIQKKGLILRKNILAGNIFIACMLSIRNLLPKCFFGGCHRPN